MKPITNWIVIADGARARIVQNNGPSKGIEPVQGLVFEGDHSPSIDILTDRPGRSFEAVGNARHAMVPTSDAHDELKSKFIRRLADALDEHVNAYNRLILVAPPEALGLLRKSLPSHVVSKVKGELGKDLTHLPNAGLPSHLDGLLAV